jgi:hypothetical protein
MPCTDNDIMDLARVTCEEDPDLAYEARRIDNAIEEAARAAAGEPVEAPAPPIVFDDDDVLPF